MTTRRRFNRLEKATVERAHEVLTAVFNADPDGCRTVARMAQNPDHEPTPEDLEALDRVKAILLTEMERAGFNPEAPAVPGLTDGWTAPAPYGRTP